MKGIDMELYMNKIMGNKQLGCAQLDVLICINEEEFEQGYVGYDCRITVGTGVRQFARLSGEDHINNLVAKQKSLEEKLAISILEKTKISRDIEEIDLTIQRIKKYTMEDEKIQQFQNGRIENSLKDYIINKLKWLVEFDLSKADWVIDYRKIDKVSCYNDCSNEVCVEFGGNGNFYCIDCLRDLPKCPTCGVYFETKEDLNEIGDGDGFICDECLTYGDVEFVRCESERSACNGTIIHKSAAKKVDCGDGEFIYICESCQELYNDYDFANEEEMEDFYEDLMEE